MSRVPQFLALAGIVMLLATGASAANGVVVDQYGNGMGTLNKHLLFLIPSVGVNADSGLSVPVLTYTMPFSEPAGDVIIHDATDYSVVRDVVRFTGGDEMIYMSLAGTSQPGVLTDVPYFPSDVGQFGTFSYDATDLLSGGQYYALYPGGADGLPYTFISTTPEPVTLVCLAAGGVMTLLRRKRR